MIDELESKITGVRSKNRYVSKKNEKKKQGKAALQVSKFYQNKSKLIKKLVLIN
ncbi:MAG: hypothetical protein LBJ61_03105 [Deltaproteobacteria bacterium]|nr:hypothetical protein [Deltaproteobacteria bacterium]